MASNSHHSPREHETDHGEARSFLLGHPGDRVSLTRTDLLTAEEVAELLQLRQSTVQDYARRGIIPSFKLGRFRRFVRADVEATVTLLRDSGE